MRPRIPSAQKRTDRPQLAKFASYPAKRTQAQEADGDFRISNSGRSKISTSAIPKNTGATGKRAILARDAAKKRKSDRLPCLDGRRAHLNHVRDNCCARVEYSAGRYNSAHRKIAERIGVDSKVNAKITSSWPRSEWASWRPRAISYRSRLRTHQHGRHRRPRASVNRRISHFHNKEVLFAEVVRATTDDVGDLVWLVSRSLADPEDFELKLLELARKFLTLMQPQMLKLRRMVIANAERFPEVGRLWYEQGFERVLRTLADCFQRLADRTVLKLDDPDDCSPTFCGAFALDPSQQDHVHA